MTTTECVLKLRALLAELRAQRDKLGKSLRRIDEGYRTIDREKHLALLAQYVELSQRCEALRICDDSLTGLWGIPRNGGQA